MAVDFSLQFACEVRKGIPEPKLVQLVKHRTIAQFAVGKFREAYPQADRETILNKCTVRINALGPDGLAKEIPVTVGQLVQMTASLDGVKGHCASCRANVADRDFVCMGKINYPIAAVSEGWLLSRLPADPQTPSLATLFRFLADLQIDGAPVEQQRGRAEMFESRTVLSRSWGSGPSQRRVTSSQLLHMLVFGGDIGAKQAQLYTQLLGLESVLRDPHPKSDNVEQFKTFFCGVVMAGRLGSMLAVEA